MPVAATPAMSNRAAFWAGVRALLPILLGTTPFGMIYGIAAIEAGLNPAEALGMSLIVFAGSSQFVAANLFAANAAGPVIVATTFVVNLRHMLYSASLAPYLKHLRPLWKYALAFLLTDEMYAVAALHYRDRTAAEIEQGPAHWFALGAGLTLWTTWQASTAVGVLLGARVPSEWSLDFTLALTFIALLIPTLADRSTVLAALAAGLTALAGHGLPYNLGLMLALVVGISVGMVAERRVDIVHDDC